MEGRNPNHQLAAKNRKIENAIFQPTKEGKK